MSKKKVTVTEVKKALELADVDIKDMFSSESWNDLRKNGRRIKMPYRTSERLKSKHVMKVASELRNMFPNNNIRIRNHTSVNMSYGGEYTSLTVHVKEL